MAQGEKVFSHIKRWSEMLSLRSLLNSSHGHLMLGYSVLLRVVMRRFTHANGDVYDGEWVKDKVRAWEMCESCSMDAQKASSLCLGWPLVAPLWLACFSMWLGIEPPQCLLACLLMLWLCIARLAGSRKG
eukprot:6479852-Amphidinium_carterae.1